MRNLTLLFILFFVACESNVRERDLCDYVDIYIGSGGHGHVFVGASVPFGMVQIGPQNINKGWDWCSGYHYSDSILLGFSHNHLSGTGCGDLGDVLVTPFIGTKRVARGKQHDISNSVASFYTHDDEIVEPGFYSITSDNGIRCNLTATERVAFHQYFYPKKEEPKVLINLNDGNSDRAVASYIKQIDDYTIEGYRVSRGWSPLHKVFFVLKTEQPIKKFFVYEIDEPKGEGELEGVGVKGMIVFESGIENVQLKVALSSVSTENAAMNMDRELSHWKFDKVRRGAREKWNENLSKIIVQTNDERAKRIFYTAMYHMFIAPTKYYDVNGEFRGHDDKIYTAEGWENYSTFSLWDTYRALNPLFTIIQPERMDDFVNSMLSIFDQQGRLPIWPLVGGETNCMPGYSAIPVISDVILKGFDGFDKERAFYAMKSSATNPRQKGVAELMENKFISCRMPEATSIAMEYAVGDWGIAAVAKKMGKMDEYDYFLERGKYYGNYFDRKTNFVRPRNADGSWNEPYDPFHSNHTQGHFCEGTGWQYTFFVPQHPEGLIELFGGDEMFISKLDSLFLVEGDMGEFASNDISGLIGQYAHGNEPSHHVAYLYTYAGEQWKTAKWVRYIQEEFYKDEPGGVIGNEDCGQISAWHVLSALGFYQVNPSNGVFVFGSPLFEVATISLPGNRIFTVRALNNGEENIYIQSVKLNGEDYTKAYITYEDIMRGGVLEFVMGAVPNKLFGVNVEDRPRSL